MVVAAPGRRWGWAEVRDRVVACRGPVRACRGPVVAACRGPTFPCRPAGPRCPASAAGRLRVPARVPPSRDLRWESAAGPTSAAVRGPRSAARLFRGRASVPRRSALGPASRRASATGPARAISIPAWAALVWETSQAASLGPAPAAIGRASADPTSTDRELAHSTDCPSLASIGRASAGLVSAARIVQGQARSSVRARCRGIDRRWASRELEIGRASATGPAGAMAVATGADTGAITGTTATFTTITTAGITVAGPAIGATTGTCLSASA